MKKLAVAGVIVAGVGLYAAWDAMNNDAIACDVDGDGRFYIEMENGDINGPAKGGWRLSDDGDECYAGGGSTEPVILQRKDLVDPVGNILKP